MDREKVIKELSKLHGSKETMEIIEQAIAMLKEQEPMKPNMRRENVPGMSYYRCYCKRCGKHVGNMVNNEVMTI